MIEKLNKREIQMLMEAGENIRIALVHLNLTGYVKESNLVSAEYLERQIKILAIHDFLIGS